MDGPGHKVTQAPAKTGEAAVHAAKKPPSVDLAELVVQCRSMPRCTLSSCAQCAHLQAQERRRKRDARERGGGHAAQRERSRHALRRVRPVRRLVRRDEPGDFLAHQLPLAHVCRLQQSGTCMPPEFAALCPTQFQHICTRASATDEDDDGTLQVAGLFGCLCLFFLHMPNSACTL